MSHRNDRWKIEQGWQRVSHVVMKRLLLLRPRNERASLVCWPSSEVIRKVM